MSGPAAHALLSELAAAGVRLELGKGGDTLELSGKRPPAELLERVRASKPALLEVLKGPQESAAPALPSPDEVKAARPTPHGTAKKEATPRPDWASIGSQPGHCGSCARWEPTGYAFEGECTAGRLAHGLYNGGQGDGDAPVYTHPAHACGASSGAAYRAKESGKRYGPRPTPQPAQVAP